MMKQTKTLVASIFVLAASVASAQDPTPTPVALDGFKVSAKIGGSVSMSSAADTLLTPIAKLTASGPLAFGSIAVNKLPILHIDGELSALPGDTIDQGSGISGTLAQFKALEFSVGISKRVSQYLALNNGKQIVSTSVYGEAGFATRLDNEEKARDKAPRYGCLGLRFDEANSSSYLKLGPCLDQRLDGTYQVTASISGMVTPFEFGSGTGVSIYVKAILGINVSSSSRPELTGSRRDSVNVGSLIGW
jgi:hypothetical protein